MSDMRYYQRCNNTYHQCCYKPQENRLAYRFGYGAKTRPFLHQILNTLLRLIKTLVQGSNTNNRKRTTEKRYQSHSFYKSAVLDIDRVSQIFLPWRLVQSPNYDYALSM